MLTNLKSGSAFALFACFGLELMTCTAWAQTADVARKCQALSLQAYPPRVPGNPAAGSAAGTAADQRSFYERCIANGGNISGEPQTGAPAQPPKEIAETEPSLVERGRYRPCPASVAFGRRNMCIGTPGRGYAVRVAGPNPERGRYRPCPASVAFNGRNRCLGAP
jgi:hypothetical protein